MKYGLNAQKDLLDSILNSISNPKISEPKHENEISIFRPVEQLEITISTLKEIAQLHHMTVEHLLNDLFENSKPEELLRINEYTEKTKLKIDKLLSDKETQIISLAINYNSKLKYLHSLGEFNDKNLFVTNSINEVNAQLEEI